MSSQFFGWPDRLDCDSEPTCWNGCVQPATGLSIPLLIPAPFVPANPEDHQPLTADQFNLADGKSLTVSFESL